MKPTPKQILRVLEYIKSYSCPDNLWPGCVSKENCYLGPICEWRSACLECWLDVIKENVKEGE